MLMAIDIGNTHTVIGIYEGEALRGQWRFSSGHTRTPDECGLLIQQLLSSLRIDFPAISGVVIASVVPPLTPVYEEMAVRYLGLNPVIAHAGLDLGITIGTDEPQRVGADRIANAVGAFHKYGGPAIVVDMGTATTFDVITAQGVYIGGAIAPGMETAASQLFDKTAQLPRIDVSRPLQVIGRTTEESMRSGIFYGAVGAINEIVAQIQTELKGRAKVIATGGLAGLVAKETRVVDTMEPSLTLDGLRLIFERVSKEET